MFRLGLTGGAGAGKSTIGRLLESRGIRVIDTDDLARQLVQPGEAALREIVSVFGQSMLDDAGKLRRDVLAARIFASQEERKTLEGILHPRIRERWQQLLARWNAEGVELGCVIIPLLFETKAEEFFDRVVAVGCSAATQSERLRSRGWSENDVRERLAAQLPLKEKLGRADFVIWTEGDPGQLEPQWSRIAAALLGG